MNSGRQSEWSGHKAAILRFHLYFFLVSPQGLAPPVVLHAPSLLSLPAVPVPVCRAGTALLFTLPSGRGTTVAR